MSQSPPFFAPDLSQAFLSPSLFSSLTPLFFSSHSPAFFPLLATFLHSHQPSSLSSTFLSPLPLRPPSSFTPIILPPPYPFTLHSSAYLSPLTLFGPPYPFPALPSLLLPILLLPPHLISPSPLTLRFLATLLHLSPPPILL